MNKIRYFRRQYGLRYEQVEKIFNEQNGKCLICDIQMVLGKHVGNSAVMDHSHKTGRNRGLLCNNCNRGIGYLYDNPDILLKAASYLQTQMLLDNFV